MNEWLTVMTSSPAPTPTARSARCSAVVQLETAQAYGAPTATANSRSNAATSGPCVTHPDKIARRAASASRSSSQGRATGISAVVLVIVTTGCQTRLIVRQESNCERLPAGEVPRGSSSDRDTTAADA